MDLGSERRKVRCDVDTEANRQLVKRFYDEVWSRGNVRFAEEVFADDYLRHDPRPTQAPSGPTGQAVIAERFRRAFPDLEWQVNMLIAERDLVAARWTASGTQSGAWGEVAPTGRQATFSGVNIFRFGENGKVVELWNHRDDLGLIEQLGARVFAGAPASVEET